MELFNKIKRVFDYLPTIWNDHDFDYAYLYDLLGKKFERMERSAKEEWYTSQRAKNVKRLMICKNLCRRIASYDAYWDMFYNKNSRLYKNGSHAFDQETYTSRNDLAHLTFLMNKYSWGWWD